MTTPGKWHEQFAAGDLNGGTVTIQSSDNVKFNIHRKNLEACTGAFPGAEFETNGEVVQLTETANVLAILFKFIYPQRHPSLEGLESALLSQVAEAAEKYEVFAAMNIASIRLSETLPDNALAVFAHGIKHNYPKLMDKAAICVARYSWAVMTQRLPVVALPAWAKYQEAFGAVFTAGIGSLTRLQQDRQTCRTRTSVMEPGFGFGGFAPDNIICNNCFFMLKAWVMTLDKVTGSTADVLWAIAHPGDMDRPSDRSSSNALNHPYLTPAAQAHMTRPMPGGVKLINAKNDGPCAACSSNDTACIHLTVVQSALQEAIRKVPLFSSFL